MNRQTSLLLAAAIIGMVIGAVVVSRLAHDEPSKGQSLINGSQSPQQVSIYDPSGFEPDQVAGILESLTSTLNEEISERRLLTQQLEQLQAEVKELQVERRDSDERAAAERRASSQARKAGLERGDVIVRYGGEPVYSNWHLVRLRSSGKLGAPVIVEITRDGQPMQITMPRGPMGFGGSQVSIDPRTNSRSRSDDGE